MLRVIMTPSPNKSATTASAADYAIADMLRFENSNAYISEKKYYLELIEFLFNLGYYYNHISIKEIWNNK